MPVVQATIIEGYDDATKSRLLQGMTRVVLSVMAAKPEGVVALLNELKPSAYARGGVSRQPGPALRAAIDVVQHYTSALCANDTAAAQSLLSEDAYFVDNAGVTHNPLLLLTSVGKLADMELDEALTDDGSVVYARHGLKHGGIGRFHVRQGRIVSIQYWGACVDAAPVDGGN